MISGSSSGAAGASAGLSVLLELGVRDDRALHREPFDVLGLLRQERLRDQQREVRVDVPGLLERRSRLRWIASQIAYPPGG
jgi:hypothetical protein